MKLESDWMEMAIEEGIKGRVNAPPNPWVGCVIVKEGMLVGKGFHSECGGAHAEISALQVAGNRAKNATVYVTLEPCSHYGRTPPCVQALIQAGVSRVVVGVKDPDLKVAGAGILALKNAGIRVDIGMQSLKVENSLKPYLHQRHTGKPFVIAKAAISIDGKVAAADGTSRWISCEEARKDAHRLRAESQAVLVGSGTALKDSPQLTVRNTENIPKKMPLRVVLDRSGKIPSSSPLFNQDLAQTLLFSNRRSAPVGVEMINETELEDILSILGNRGIFQLLLEGGPNVTSQFLNNGLIDRFIIYTGPKILGEEGLSLFQSMNIRTIDQAKIFRPLSVSLLGDTVRSEYQIL